MLLVISEFGGVPEVFVPQDRKSELDKALGITYNAHLQRGHALPWYTVNGSTGVIMDRDYISKVLHEVVAAYSL